MSEIPFVSFSNQELADAPPVLATSACPKCGEQCDVEQAKCANTKEKDPKQPRRRTVDEGLQFITHCGDTFLVGVGGKDVSGTFS